VAYVADPVFNVNGTITRRVTGRNTPSNINAVFNFRNFWDGRAQNDFNGVSPFGARDPYAYVIRADAKGANPQKTRVSLTNASLASQAVGPALSPMEMSGDGRIFQKMGRKLGKKLKDITPLAGQLVAKDDSVLGKDTKYPKPGLNTTYGKLIEKAFKPDWWAAKEIITVDANGDPVFSLSDKQLTTSQYTQEEFNFSLFWGISIMLYESTLVSDDSPFDRYMDGFPDSLDFQQQIGLELFRGNAGCFNCHGGPEFTNAAVANVATQRLEPMVMGDLGSAVYDNGFYNIGVRPTGEDKGVGGMDPFGNPLSDTRMSQLGLFVDPVLGVAIPSTYRVAVDGSFKAPSLRNVELTGPYFHNGGQQTLRQVVEFYNRGGDFHEANIDNLAPDIEGIGLGESQIQALVAFLKSLTDERVRKHAAPFDHPQLFIPNGHPGDENLVGSDGTGKAIDNFREIPMTGAGGYATPLPNFLEPGS
jgi:cytochrome c peroxidase